MKSDQTITFTDDLSGLTYGDDPLQLTASSSSGLPIAYASTGPISIAGDMLTIEGVGDATVTAAQAGDETYNPADPITLSFEIAEIVEEIVISNQMTLNGDGLNDFWEVEEFPEMTSSSFKIFDKRGNEIYSSIGYDTPWNGIYGGSQVPDGVYYYVINGPVYQKSGYILVTR